MKMFCLRHNGKFIETDNELFTEFTDDPDKAIKLPYDAALRLARSVANPDIAVELEVVDIDTIRRSTTMEKTLHNSDVSGARQNVKDISVVGNGDMFQLLCKASSQAEGWMKSTKACEIPGVGCLVQVTTQQRNADGSYAVAEALTFVPGVRIIPDDNNGRKLVDNIPEE